MSTTAMTVYAILGLILFEGALLHLTWTIASNQDDQPYPVTSLFSAVVVIYGVQLIARVVTSG